MLEGSITLRDLSNQLHWDFPRMPGIETLAGFLLAELGHIPEVGEHVSHGGRRFTVAEMVGRRIARVRVDLEAGRTSGGDIASTEDDGLEVPA